MKNKKVIILALVAVMVIGIAVPAFAANQTSTKINGAYEELPIDVVVMPTGKAVINPYKMPIKPKDTATTSAEIGKTITTAGQISTYPLAMYNKGDVDLAVGATVTASNVTGVELVTTSIPASSTDKQAQVYLEAKQDTTLDGDDYSVTADTTGYIVNVKGDTLCDAFNAWTETTYDRTSTSQVIVNPDEPTRAKEIAKMKKADPTTGQPQAGSYVLYRLAGKCVEAPDTAWATTDKFEVDVAFTFSPTTITP